MAATKMLDPVCDMIVDLAEARDQGLTLELPDREYAFCGQGCQTKFAKSPETYKACRCCMHDAYPAVVEQLDAERAAVAQAPSDAGICETAEAHQPSSP